MEPVKEYLSQCNKSHDSLSKMQAAYGTLAIAMLLIAGLVSLINQSLGQSLLFLSFVLVLTFIGNSVVWALLSTFVIPRISSTKRPTSRKK